MQKIFFSVVFAFLVICTAGASTAISADGYGDAASRGARQTVESDVQDTMNNAREAYDAMGQDTYEETIPRPEDIQSAASSCLDGILNADFGYGLGVPSIKSLFNNACKSINSGVKDHLNNVNFELSDQYTRIGAGMGNNRIPNTVNYNEVGQGIADDLWGDIAGEKKW